MITVQRQGDRLALAGEDTVEQLWEHEFVHVGRYTFEAAENREYRLVFSGAPNGMMMSITLGGRVIGDATRVK